MERANIIPHYTARNLLDSTGILGLGRPNNGTAGEQRLGRAGWPRLLTWNQRPALTSTRPVFHPALPAAPQDHETLMHRGCRGLITEAVMSHTQDLGDKRASGVTWMTET